MEYSKKYSNEIEIKTKMIKLNAESIEEFVKRNYKEITQEEITEQSLGYLPGFMTGKINLIPQKEDTIEMHVANVKEEVKREIVKVYLNTHKIEVEETSGGRAI